MFKYIKNKYISFLLVAILLLAIAIVSFMKFKGESLLFENQMVEIEQASKSQSNENQDIKIDNNKTISKETKTLKNITVYITGEVSSSGVITLKEGSRLDDGIKKLGGVTKEADLNAINLAMVMEDGQHYIIPNKNELQTSEENSTNTNVATNKTINSSENNKKENSLINVNRASQEELESLPGVGPSTAKKIIDYRESEGKLSTIEDVKNVNGIGEKKFESMKDFISVN